MNTSAKIDHREAISSSALATKDEAAMDSLMVDSFFLPGGILDPDIDDEGKEEEDMKMRQQPLPLSNANDWQTAPALTTTIPATIAEVAVDEAPSQKNSFWSKSGVKTSTSSNSYLQRQQLLPSNEPAWVSPMPTQNQPSSALEDSFHGNQEDDKVHDLLLNPATSLFPYHNSNNFNESFNTSAATDNIAAHLSMLQRDRSDNPRLNTPALPPATRNHKPRSAQEQEDVRQMVLALSSSLQNIGETPNDNLPDHLLRPDSPPKIIRRRSSVSVSNRHAASIPLEFPYNDSEDDLQSITSSLSSGSAGCKERHSPVQLSNQYCPPIASLLPQQRVVASFQNYVHQPTEDIPPFTPAQPARVVPPPPGYQPLLPDCQPHERSRPGDKPPPSNPSTSPLPQPPTILNIPSSPTKTMPFPSTLLETTADYLPPPLSQTHLHDNSPSEESPVTAQQPQPDHIPSTIANHVPEGPALPHRRSANTTTRTNAAASLHPPEAAPPSSSKRRRQNRKQPKRPNNATANAKPVPIPEKSKDEIVQNTSKQIVQKKSPRKPSSSGGKLKSKSSIGRNGAEAGWALQAVKRTQKVVAFVTTMLSLVVQQAAKEALEQKSITVDYAVLFFTPIICEFIIDKWVWLPHFFPGIAMAATVAMVCHQKKIDSLLLGLPTLQLQEEEPKKASPTTPNQKSVRASTGTDRANKHIDISRNPTRSFSSPESHRVQELRVMEATLCQVMLRSLRWSLPAMIVVMSMMQMSGEPDAAPCLGLVAAFALSMLKTCNLFSPLCWLSGSVQLLLVLGIRGNHPYFERMCGMEIFIVFLGLCTLRFLRLRGSGKCCKG